MANVPRLSKILRGKDTKPQTELESAIKYAIDNAGSGGGGSDLPEPGTSGNVLTSTGTAWESAAPSGEKVYVTVTSDGEESYEADTDISVLKAAYDAGKSIFAKFGEYDEIPVVSVGSDSVEFAQTKPHGESECKGVIVVGTNDGNDDSWFAGEMTLVGVPNASSLYNGKVLGVSDGAYALVDPSELANGTVVFSATEENDDVTLSDNKSVADIYTAAAAGKIVFLNVENMLLPITSWGNDGTKNAASFSGAICGLNSGTQSYEMSVIGVSLVEDGGTVIGKMLSSTLTLD